MQMHICFARSFEQPGYCITNFYKLIKVLFWWYIWDEIIESKSEWQDINITFEVQTDESDWLKGKNVCEVLFKTLSINYQT